MIDNEEIEMTNAEVVLTSTEHEALKEFQKHQEREKQKAKDLKSEVTKLESANMPLESCSGECKLESANGTLDSLKAVTTQKLLELNANFEAKFKAIIDDNILNDADKITAKKMLIAQNEETFNKVISDANATLETRIKDTEQNLFTSKTALSPVDVSLMANPEIINKMMQRPYEYLNAPTSLGNAGILWHLNQRGLLSDTYRQNNSLKNAINSRFSKEPYEAIAELQSNREKLDLVQSEQQYKFNSLKPRYVA